MVIQILPRDQSFGEQLGTALGTGLADSLQLLAQQRIKDLERRQTATGLEELLGLKPEQSQAYATLDPLIQREFVKQKLLEPRLAQQGALLAQQGLPAEISLLPQSAQGALIKRLLPQAEEAQLESLLSQPDKLKTIDQRQTESPISVAPESQEPIKAEQITSKRLSYPPAPQAKAQEELLKYYDILKREDLTPAQRSRIKKEIDVKEDKFAQQQEKVDKSTQKIYDKINDDAEAAEDGNQRLEKMLELINTGKLVGPITGAVLDTLEHGIPALGVGLNLYGLTSTQTQEFKKLQADFLRDVKKIFGSRVTNEEVKRYTNRIPSLTQTDEGKRMVVRDLKLFNDANLARKKAMQDIIDENNGYRPPNLEDLIEKRSKSELDRIAKEFKEPYVSPQQLAHEQAGRKSPLLTALGDLLALF